MSVKPKWNLALDALIALAFLGTAVSGLVFFFDLAARGAAEGWLLTRDAWRSLHDWFGLAMMAGVGIHVLVHMKWIVYATLQQLGLRGRKPQRAAGTAVPVLGGD